MLWPPLLLVFSPWLPVIEMPSKSDAVITMTDDEDEEEESEAAAAIRKKEEEEELTKQKEHQASMELIHVFIACIIMVSMAAGTVAFKLWMWPDQHVITFHPLPQQVEEEVWCRK